MINFYVRLSLAFFISTGGIESPGYPVIIKITRTEPYCGGAAPSDEMVKESQKKKIAFSEIFYLIQGSENKEGRRVIQKFRMDSSGYYCKKLAPGKYSVINEYSFQKLTIDSSHYNVDCIKKLWAAPMFRFTVSKSGCDTILFNINKYCSYNEPCKNRLDNIPM